VGGPSGLGDANCGKGPAEVKLNIASSSLIDALSKCVTVADGKSPMPILGCVLIDTRGDTTFKASSLSQDITVRPDSVSIDVPGLVAVGARTLLDRVKAMPDGELKLSTKDNQLLVSSVASKRRFAIYSVPGEDFPSFNRTLPVGMSLPKLDQLIAKTAFAMSGDPTRANVHCLLLESSEGLRCVATDGHRLALAAVDCLEPFEACLVPSSAVAHIAKMSNPEIGFDKANIYAISGGAIYRTAKVDAAFPPYRQVIPKRTKFADVHVDAIVEAIGAASKSSDPKTGSVRLQFEPGVIQIMAESAEMGTSFDEVACDHDFTGKISASARYLMDAFKACGEVARMSIDGELDPILITGEEDGITNTNCVMPMRG